MVYAALENWDDKINTWLPNTCDPEWFAKSGILTTLGEYLTNVAEDNNAIPTFTLPLYNNLIYKHKDSLIGKTNYVYLVNISNVLYFQDHKDLGFSKVDPRILEDVRNGLCDIIFIQDIEGMSGGIGEGGEQDFMILNDWVREANLPGEMVHYICANLLSGKIAKDKYNVSYNVIPLTVQDIWINIENFPGPAINFKPVNGKHLFLTYSRRPRPMRVYFYSTLVREGLIDKGTASFHFLDWGIPYEQQHELDPTIRESLVQLYNMCPLQIDRENVSDDITVYMNINDYKHTFISIVTETLFTEDVLFHSEKIWKPIITGHPFMVLGNKGHLEWLKSQGFKTFDRWIDESYDLLDSMVDRSNAVTKELARFSKMSVQELQKIREEMFEICDYNKNHMRERVKKRFFVKDKYGERLDRLLPQAEEIQKIHKKTRDKLNSIAFEHKSTKSII